MDYNAKPISLRFSTEPVFYDMFDPISQVITIVGDILYEDFSKDDDVIHTIGKIKLITAPVNIIDLTFDQFEIIDSHSIHLADAVFTLFNPERELRYDILPVDGLIHKLEKLNLLYIQTLVLHKDYTGYHITEQVFDILKMMFTDHLFLLKPYPLQHSNKEDKTEYAEFILPSTEINLSTGVAKLKKVYSSVGFKTLKGKMNSSYMVLLNYVI